MTQDRREAIARIIDPEAWTFQPWNENWRLVMQDRQAKALAKADAILAGDPSPGLIEALESIAKNTCCDTCREAALVASAALRQARGEAA